MNLLERAFGPENLTVDTVWAGDITYSAQHSVMCSSGLEIRGSTELPHYSPSGRRRLAVHNARLFRWTSQVAGQTRRS